MLEFNSFFGPLFPSRDVEADAVLSRDTTVVISSIKCSNKTLELVRKGFFFNSILDSEFKFSLVVEFDALLFSYDGLLLLTACIYLMSFYRS